LRDLHAVRADIAAGLPLTGSTMSTIVDIFSIRVECSWTPACLIGTEVTELVSAHRCGSTLEAVSRFVSRSAGSEGMAVVLEREDAR